MWQIAKTATRLHPSFCTSTFQSDFSAPPIKSQPLSPSLELGWPCDLLCVTQCSPSDSVSVLSLSLKTTFVLTHTCARAPLLPPSLLPSLSLFFSPFLPPSLPLQTLLAIMQTSLV